MNIPQCVSLSQLTANACEVHNSSPGHLDKWKKCFGHFNQSPQIHICCAFKYSHRRPIDRQYVSNSCIIHQSPQSTCSRRNFERLYKKSSGYKAGSLFFLLLITIIVGWLNGPDLRPIISQYHTRVGFWKGLITMLNNPRCQGAVTYNVTPMRADPITLFFRNVLGKQKLT